MVRKINVAKAMAGFLSQNLKNRILWKIFYLAGINPGFQNELTGRANIRLLGSAYGVNDIDLENLEKDVEEFVDLGQDLDRKVSSYSSGMRSKLGFGFITALDCDLLLMDEALGAGDREFRHKANLRLSQFIDKAGARLAHLWQSLVNATNVLLWIMEMWFSTEISRRYRVYNNSQAMVQYGLHTIHCKRLMK